MSVTPSNSMEDSSQEEYTSEEANRYLTKTAIKSVLWLAIAYVVTYFFPDQNWVWYVVLTFVCISIGFAIFTKILAIGVAKAENDATSE